ncbi:Cyclin-dependent kinase 7 [Caenorhabditis elegans]|uniref:Cyclin-dependent kinase 7 n=1 Tax=Caenorhabditis elegans TaxID=6239 RepID=CDK7_CAEEL|nr:Cyclin-dependent kinase 7 [Caenorhabditis elegans]G5EFV5.1 RecName: Full=Cyclin-dependent kinase 7; AltName: Full=Cell division protein kinase 7 [Caenorhabditis elegans]AAD38186.1 cyclin-dependent kinase 7 homolog [Caenorhabditis elegans]CCD69307.1 Cyclin-dependent kinase 7 [Caenorhabditis elegans]|eukprot:NP_490952.2 Cyclin-dependent kinase 7 [Caenorhabditis elegans]
MSRRYDTIKHLGEGQFANVYLAQDLESGECVAIKKIKLGSREEAKDGINRTAIREIKLLKEIHHDNIIGLRDVIGHRTSIQLVFDFMDTDLEHVIKDKEIILMPAHIKNITMQMLLGLEFLHVHWILHRDLKPNNLLMNKMGRVKLTDFGLARFFGSPNRNYTHQVVTRWYRAPELLFGARSYGVGIDIWSVGCIIAELLLRNPIFPGESDIDQLVKIFNILGCPTPETWPNMTEMNSYVIIKPQTEYMALNYYFSAAPQDLLDLMAGMWTFDPIKRLTCTQSLQMEYFRTQPFCCLDEELPLPKKQQPQKRSRRLDDDGTRPVRRLNFD